MLWQDSTFNTASGSGGPSWKAMDLLEQVWWRVTNIITGQEHLSYENGLRWLGFFILEKRKLQRDLIEPFSIYRRLTGKKKRTLHPGRQ